MQSSGGPTFGATSASSGGNGTYHATPLSHNSSRPSTFVQQPQQQQQHQQRVRMSAAARHRESPSGLTSSYHTEETKGDDSPRAATSVGTAVATRSIDALSPSLLSNLQRDYPTAYAALCVYEKAIRHHKERFQAKEAELLRCISVGEELLGQLDALKQRCETLAHERDAAVASAETHSTPNLLNRERAAQRDVAEATRVAEEEERKRSLVHGAQCAHLREQLQDALQHTAIAQAERREVEATLQKTREQLRNAEEHVRRVEEACQEREAAYAAQCDRDLQQQRSALQRQVGALQQQAELDRETVLAESTVELERLQRALVRAEKELEEHQRVAQRSSTALLMAESKGAATVEVTNLRRQIRQLEDINHDLQLRLRRKSAEAGESRLVVVQGGEAGGNGHAVGVCASSSTACTNGYPPGSSHMDDAAAVSASLTLQHRLQEQNAHLKDKLQSVNQQAQAEMDKAHEARLELQRHVASLEAQLLLLRTSVVGGLEEELQRARENTDASEARGRELQEIADALDTRATALHRELTQTAASLDAERQTSGHLREELKAAQDAVDAARQDTDAVMEEVARKDPLIAQQQRERQQLITALRTLQAETANIEGALTEMSVRHEEGVVSGEMNVARLQERCVLLEHEVEAAQEERLTLFGRLRDAEEAVAVLTDAQRVSQEAVRDAQRRASEAAERASVSTEQLRGQQQHWVARATAAEEEAERLRRQLRDVTQRLRDGEAEILRKDEALRHNQDKVAAVAKEMRQLREQQEHRESTSREQWRQQYAQNAADREKIIHDKEQMIQDLVAELQALRKTAAQRGEEVQQLQLQRQQAQSALSEAVTSMASYKGRLLALEEELKRVERERAEARAEVQRLAVPRRERSAEGESGESSNPSARAFTTQRVSELESKLSSCEEALRAADAQRLQAQTALMQLVVPPSSSPSDATLTPHSNTHRWDDVVDALDAGIHDLSLAAAASLSTAPPPPHYPQREESSDDVDDTTSCSTLDAALPDACQRASAAVLRAARDWIEFLHDEDERRWSTLKQTALTLFAAHDAEATVPRAQEAARSSPRRGGGWTALYSAGELHERFIAAQQAFAASMEAVRKGWTMAVAERKSHGAQQHKAQEAARVAELNSLLEGKEADCVALQRTIDELLQQQAETAQKQTSLEQIADQLRADVAARDARLAELEHRLDTRTTAAQAEREEWLAKWRESQRHRSKEREDHEAALQALRKELAAAEDAAAVAVDTRHRKAEETQQQLRTQLQELQNTAAAAEAALHQQVHALTQDKAQATQALRRVRAVVTELEERVRAAEEAVRTKEEQLAATQAAMEELKRAHHQTLANGAAAGTFGQETLTQQVASLRAQLSTSRQDYELMEKTHAAERAELQALRRVNASLEARLAEVEEDRAPLRQQLHSLLAFADE